MSHLRKRKSRDNSGEGNVNILCFLPDKEPTLPPVQLDPRDYGYLLALAQIRSARGGWDPGVPASSSDREALRRMGADVRKLERRPWAAGPASRLSATVQNLAERGVISLPGDVLTVPARGSHRMPSPLGSHRRPDADPTLLGALRRFIAGS
jgi:hypothetical protein